MSWFEAKARIVREAIRAYLAHPLYVPPTGQVLILIRFEIFTERNNLTDLQGLKKEEPVLNGL